MLGGGGPPALADLATYRIAQDALTNAARYGDGDASLTLSYTADQVRVQVQNRVAVPAVPSEGSGYGILGMRERATAAGGTLTAGLRDSGRFVVQAVLPAAAEEVVS